MFNQQYVLEFVWHCLDMLKSAKRLSSPIIIQDYDFMRENHVQTHPTVACLIGDWPAMIIKGDLKQPWMRRQLIQPWMDWLGIKSKIYSTYKVLFFHKKIKNNIINQISRCLPWCFACSNDSWDDQHRFPESFPLLYGLITGEVRPRMNLYF